LIDDVFAQRVFDNFDRFEKKLDNTCSNVAGIKTDVEVLKTNFNNHMKNKQEDKSNKRDRRDWLFGIVSFVFFAYIAINVITNG